MENNPKNNNFNEKAYFGKFGGQYVPETAMFALIELEKVKHHYFMQKILVTTMVMIFI